ncbi:hypothetical protein GCM10029964_111250 [Kibdelosporangium lantanae]
MPAPKLTRCLPATAILGAGLVLATATPAAAEPAPMATVVARGERDATTGPPPPLRTPSCCWWWRVDWPSAPEGPSPPVAAYGPDHRGSLPAVGRLVVIEGLDGSGKRTLGAALTEAVQRRGADVAQHAFPATA